MRLLLLKAILAGLFFFFGTAAAAAICAALVDLGERASRWLRRRRERIADREERVRSIMAATTLLDPRGSDLSKATTAIQARPFVIEVSPFMYASGQTVPILRQIICELRAQDRQRYFPGDRTGEVN